MTYTASYHNTLMDCGIDPLDRLMVSNHIKQSFRSLELEFRVAGWTRKNRSLRKDHFHMQTRAGRCSKGEDDDYLCQTRNGVVSGITRMVYIRFA